MQDRHRGRASRAVRSQAEPGNEESPVGPSEIPPAAAPLPHDNPEMEFVMRLARGRAGWALTAAGTFGLTVAAAQVSVDKALAASPPQAMAATAVDGGFARVIEIRVELAWL